MDYKEQIKEMSANYEFLKLAATRQGFFKLYFKELPGHRTYVECFNYINNKFFDLAGEYRYSSYNSFRQELNKSS